MGAGALKLRYILIIRYSIRTDLQLEEKDTTRASVSRTQSMDLTKVTRLDNLLPLPKSQSQPQTEVDVPSRRRARDIDGKLNYLLFYKYSDHILV